MTREDWFLPKWRLLKQFGLAAVAGLVAVVVGLQFEIPAIGLIGALLIVPFVFWLAFLPVLHWKDRYIGAKSGVWGGFLVFETSGWSKVIYWFRHVLPDWRRSDRYRDAL